MANFDFEDIPLLGSLPRDLTVRSVRTDETLDYSGLVRRVSERASELADKMPQGNRRIVIGGSEPIETLVSLFACWAAGHCAVLVNSGLKPDEQSRVISKVSPDLWISDDGTRKIDGVSEPSHWPDAALILMTSGTTGDPKGITHSLAGLSKRLELNIQEIGKDTLRETLCPLPLFFGHGLIGNCLTALMAGGNLHILQSPTPQDLAGLGELMDRFGISFLSSVPTFWRMALRLSPPPKKGPERVHVGSAPLTLSLWKDIEEWCGTNQVFNTYGMTETANWISGGTRPPNSDEGFVGRPWGGAFKVLDEGLLESFGRGEVAIQSPSLMLGIWGHESEDNTVEGYFLTGDIGELSQDQSLRLVGRSKNEINRAGIKVLAEEVDLLLERHPDVAEACAFGIPDEMSGELVCAVVRLTGDAEATETAIIGWCRDHARAEAVPYRIAIVEEIAKNDRGKLARQKVREELLKQWQ